MGALIRKQDYLVSRTQVLAAGLSPSVLRHRLRLGGPWSVCLPGVYLTVTGRPTQAQREIAAILYGGTPHKLRSDRAFVMTTMKNAYKSGTARPRLRITALPAVS